MKWYRLKLPPVGSYYGRSLGELIYDVARKEMLRMPEGNALVITFPERRQFDAAFFDASLVRFGKELAAGGYGERGLLLQELEPDGVFNLDAAIALRESSAAFLHITPHKWQVVGHLANSHMDTLKLVVRHGSLSAPELAKQRGITLPAANNRLKRLYKARLAWRSAVQGLRGVTYTYHSWQWSG
jgi:Winged helix-turn-helix DNA-binding